MWGPTLALNARYKDERACRIAVVKQCCIETLSPYELAGLESLVDQPTSAAQRDHLDPGVLLKGVDSTQLAMERFDPLELRPVGRITTVAIW